MGTPTMQNSEYTFYTTYDPNISHTAEEQTYYQMLSDKVRMYGSTNVLNKGGMQSVGWVSDYTPLGSEANPHFSNTLEQAKQWSGGHQLNPVPGKPGLYRDQSLAPATYVFVLSKVNGIGNQQRQKDDYYVQPYVPPIITPPTPKIGPWGKPHHQKQVKPVMKKIGQDYDLLFNALEYTKTYEDEIQRITMGLIASGDDLLTNYNYESIDFLPDIDIEVKTQSGEYVNSKNIFEFKEVSDFIESSTDESQASEDIQLVNDLITYIEDNIGQNVSYSSLIDKYGSFKTDNLFYKQVPRGKEFDFFIEIPERYKDLDIEIHFDVI